MEAVFLSRLSPWESSRRSRVRGICKCEAFAGVAETGVGFANAQAFAGVAETGVGFANT